MSFHISIISITIKIIIIYLFVCLSTYPSIHVFISKNVVQQQQKTLFDIGIYDTEIISL